MAKTLQEQYNQIKKGKGSKEIFLKEAKQQFPNMIHVAATFNQATEILKQRSVITENMIGAAIASPKKPDWFKIFDDNMNIIEEETAAAKKDEAVKAVASKPNKEVVDKEIQGYDYKDNKLIDNLNGEEFRLGVNYEMSQVEGIVNDADLGEELEKAKKKVAKNLASDPLYYIKNHMFGQQKLGYATDYPALSLSKSDQMEKVKLNENKMISLVNLLENGPLGEKPKRKKRIKKETIDTKLAEIDKASQIVALEAKIQALGEVINSKTSRINLVNEDNDLSELIDKTKIKAIQKEVRILEKRKAKMEKLYEKMSGKRYKEMVDEESNGNSNLGSNDNSNENSNENPESYSGLEKFKEDN